MRLLTGQVNRSYRIVCPHEVLSQMLDVAVAFVYLKADRVLSLPFGLLLRQRHDHRAALGLVVRVGITQGYVILRILRVVIYDCDGDWSRWLQQPLISHVAASLVSQVLAKCSNYRMSAKARVQSNGVWIQLKTQTLTFGKICYAFPADCSSVAAVRFAK